jgi:Arc/MetJ-type ribon-helix-helix transcriptional regulator
MKGSDATAGEWPSAEEKAKSVAQAIALREQAKAGGLRFSVYLPPGLAEWMLGLVENGTFIDPSEAVFVLLQEAQELEPHHDLRHELLNRILQAAANDPRPGIPAEEVFRQLKEKLASSPEPAVWEKHTPVSS